jgi:hypothetical protein
MLSRKIEAALCQNPVRIENVDIAGAHRQASALFSKHFFFWFH